MNMQDSFNLEGKVALVTGASGAIGQEISVALADAGADIIVAGRNRKRLEKTAQLVAKCDRKYRILCADLAHPQEVHKLAQNSLEAFGHVDIAVNNAGTNVFNKAELFTEKDFDLIINTNLKSAFFLSQCLMKSMKSSDGGCFIFISSILGQMAMDFACLYGATKAALIQMTRSMAFEWAKYDIRVNSISPGPWSTGMLEPLFGDANTQKSLARLSPSRRLGDDGDLGRTVVFLVSDAARHVTGHNLVVDGGFSICKVV